MLRSKIIRDEKKVTMRESQHHAALEVILLLR